MAFTLRSQVVQKVRQNDVPRDYVVNTVYHSTTQATIDYQAHANSVRDAFAFGNALTAAQWQVYQFRELTVKVYDMADIPPRPERAVAVHTPVSWEVLPLSSREIALCLSFYASYNRPRFRGRIYTGPFLETEVGEVPPTNLMDQVLNLGDALGRIGPAGMHWVVYSQKNKNAQWLTNIWVNDLWDHMSSREQKEATRRTGTITPPWRMPAAPYSVNIFRYPGFSGGPTLVYTTPAGYRAVLKSITVVWGDLIASGMDFWLQTAEGCKLIRSTWFATPSDVANRGGTNLYWGSWVLEEGEPLSAQSVAGTVDVQANGYLLRLP